MGHAGLRTGIGVAAIVAAVVALALLAGPCDGGAGRDAGPSSEIAPDAPPEEPVPGVAAARPRAQRPEAAPTPASPVEAPTDEEDDDEETDAPPGELRVLCVHADTGEPIPNLRVEVRWPGKHPWGRTGPDGVWVAPRPPKPAKIRAGEDAEVNGQWYLDAEADVAAGAEEVRVEVSTTGVVAGTVVGEDGTGVRNAEVTVRARGLLALAWSDTTGEFAVRVPEGMQVEVESSLFDDVFRYGTSGPVTATSQGLVVRLVPDPIDAEFEALVLDPDGRAVPGAQVFAGFRIHVRGGVRISASNPLPQPATAVTGPDGRARLRGLPRVAVSVSARAPAESSAGLIATAVEEVSARGQQVTLTLRRGWVLSGNVEFADGSFAANVAVIVRGEGGAEVVSAHTNNAGRFSADVPAAHAGPFRVIAQLSRHRGEKRDVAAGAADVRIVLVAPD